MPHLYKGDVQNPILWISDDEHTTQIAPHEGNELDMLLAGTKVFAILERDKASDLREEFLHNRLRKYSAFHWAFIDDDLALWLPNHSAYFNMYETLLETKATYIKLFGKEDYQRKMGKLFGYSDTDIEAFINNPPACNCGKCGG